MVREKLAEYAHKAWAGWMRYMFSKSAANDDGSVTIPKSLVDRWKRQMNTEYESLPGNEKASDRKEADEMLAITGLTEAQKTAHNEGYKKGYKDGWADGYHDGKNES